LIASKSPSTSSYPLKLKEIFPLAELAPSSIPKIPLVSRLPKTFPMTYGLILKTIITNIINLLLKILIISPPWPCHCLILDQPQPSSRLGYLYQPRYHVSPPSQVYHTHSPSQNSPLGHDGVLF